LLEESTTKKTCDKDLLVDYNSYQKLFTLFTESDDGTPYPTASQALRYSDNNMWRANAYEEQIFTMNFTLNDKCSDKWEIATINFKTAFAKQVQLKEGNTVIHTWVCEFSIIVLYFLCHF
jgi:hypothetical protein